MADKKLVIGVVAAVGILGAGYVFWCRFSTRKSIKISIAESTSHRSAGNLLYKKGDLDESLTKYMKALEVLEGQPDIESVLEAREKAQLNCAAVYLGQGRYQDAVRACSKIIVRTGAAPEALSKALYRRAQALKELDRKEEAIADLEEANRICPDKEIEKMLAQMRENYKWGEVPN